MMRVVEVMPDGAQIAASGLKAADFAVDREAYRHFVEQYRREYGDFKKQFDEKGRAAAGAADPERPDAVTGSEETCIGAFERSRPPFCYHRGSVYRYRVDRSGTDVRPILLERAELSEVSGSIAGIPISSEHRGLLIRFCIWAEQRLQERKLRKKG
jgi:hypothetical protein